MERLVSITKAIIGDWKIGGVSLDLKVFQKGQYIHFMMTNNSKEGVFVYNYVWEITQKKLVVIKLKLLSKRR